MKKNYKTYLITGLPDGDFGANHYFRFLTKNSNPKISIIRPNIESIKLSNFKNNLFKNIYLIRLFFSLIFFKLRCLGLINKRIIIFHFQSIGIFTSSFLIFFNKQIKIYTLDSSFFCLKSYNNYANKECLRCIDSFNPYKECKPFPFLNFKFSFKFFYILISRKISKIIFIVQNDLQKKLLINKYGLFCRVIIVGMVTETIKYEINHMQKKKIYDSFYDECLIYHGSEHEAKGIDFIIYNLFNIDQKIIFPFKKPLKYNHIKNRNFIFKPMTWDTGLREYILKCKAVLCPSIWSSPIEAALIKSLILNNNVITFKSLEFSYTKELPDEITYEINHTNYKQIIHKIFNQNKHDQIRKRLIINSWLSKYLKNIKDLDYVCEI